MLWSYDKERTLRADRNDKPNTRSSAVVGILLDQVLVETEDQTIFYEQQPRAQMGLLRSRSATKQVLDTSNSGTLQPLVEGNYEAWKTKLCVANRSADLEWTLTENMELPAALTETPKK